MKASLFDGTVFPFTVIQIFGDLFEFIIGQAVEEIQDDSGNAKSDAGIQGHSSFDAKECHFALYSISNVAREDQDAGTYDSSQCLCDFTREVESSIGNAFFTNTIVPFTVVDDVGNEGPGNTIRDSQSHVADGTKTMNE